MQAAQTAANALAAKVRFIHNGYMQNERQHAACPLIHLASADSTNRVARSLFLDGRHLPFAVVADRQTAGRGRQGRTFYSPHGSGLYFTYAGEPPEGRTPGQITCAAAVAAVEAIFSVYGIRAGIKWINDLVFAGRKVGGILAEQSGSQLLLVGIGINIWTADFPDELLDLAGSLFGDAPASDRRLELAAALCRILDQHFSAEPAETLAHYRQSLVHLNRPILVRSGTLAGKRILTRDIDQYGRLVAESEDGAMHVLEDGEISLSGKDTL